MSWIKSLIIAVGLAFSASLWATTDTVDLNTASAKELTTLEGIGRAKADAIVQYRHEQGGFQSIEEITQVRGISQSILDKNKHRVVISPIKKDDNKKAP